MDSVLKLVYDNWVPGTRIPLPNGVSPEITKYLTEQLLSNHQSSVGDVQEEIRRNTVGNPFQYDHSNFLGYFMKRFQKTDVVKVEDVSDDGIYILPLEIRSSTDEVCNKNKIVFKGKTIEYSLFDTFSPALISLLQKGKVKVLFNLAHDPLDEMDQLWDIEKYFEQNGVAGENIVFVPGNDCSKEYLHEYPSAKLKVSPSRFLVSQQAALDVTSFPRPTSLGYISDIVRESDLNDTVLRPKRFVCFNRTMRPHRFMIAYLALKHKLLDNSIFSFLNGFNYNEEHIERCLKSFTDANDLKDYARKIHRMIPYELDTQHLPISQKSGFSTENTKKEWYTSTYIHLISETRFQRGDTPFISEKTWRPIANLQPFIMIGNYHSLRVLHDLGFKTFHPFIDESYDEETDSHIRMEKIEKEIEKLNNMPIQELHNLYYQMKDILIYNQIHLNTLAHIHPYEETYINIINFYKKDTNGI